MENGNLILYPRRTPSLSAGRSCPSLPPSAPLIEQGNISCIFCSIQMESSQQTKETVRSTGPSSVRGRWLRPNEGAHINIGPNYQAIIPDLIRAGPYPTPVKPPATPSNGGAQ